MNTGYIDSHGGNTFFKDIELDFSANINPLGMPESVRQAVIKSIDECEKYPDPYCRNLRKSIAEKISFNMENIVVGNGAADLIYRIAHTLKPEKSLVLIPAFSEYEKALREVESDIVYVQLEEKNNFSADEKILNYIDSSVDLIFIASPNNPTGKIIDKNLLVKIAEKCTRTNTALIIDECFLDFAENGGLLSIGNFINPNIIILKAFTKIYAMAGIRLGYAVFGDINTAKKTSQNGQFWSVSAIAQSAGIAALNESDYIKETVSLIKKEREFLYRNLNNLNLKTFPSDVNFILFKSHIPIDKLLLKEKILIRNCSNYKGLGNNFYRIAVRNHSENVRLINALRRCLNG